MIEVKELAVSYENLDIIKNLSLKIKEGEIVSILGPNGSGKSTLLKSLAKIIEAKGGEATILDKDVFKMSNRELSKILSMVSQQNTPPSDITVEELVAFGRTPHKKWYETKTAEDDEIINWAMKNTGVDRFKGKKVSNLSGGERQRVYIAMSLAQKPNVLFLDEPTTYLDMCHQLELMELVRSINKELNITVVMVLHDLNQAARYSHRLVIMKNGEIVADGKPCKVLKEGLIHDVYNVKCAINNDPTNKFPQIYPLEVCYSRKDRCDNCEL